MGKLRSKFGKDRSMNYVTFLSTDAGRTDGRLRYFIFCPMHMHSIGQTINNKRQSDSKFVHGYTNNQLLNSHLYGTFNLSLKIVGKGLLSITKIYRNGFPIYFCCGKAFVLLSLLLLLLLYVVIIITICRTRNKLTVRALAHYYSISFLSCYHLLLLKPLEIWPALSLVYYTPPLSLSL